MTPVRRPEPAVDTRGRRARASRLPWAAFGVDVALVVVFAMIGRTSHAEGITMGGLVTTASPFLAGTVAAWALLASKATGLRPAGLPAGTLVWAATLIVGMVLRAITGQTVALSFVIVAGVSLALFLIGWRALGAWLVARSTR